MSENRKDIVKYQGLVVVGPADRQLIKINRMLMGLLLVLMATVIVMGVYFLPNRDIVRDYSKISPIETVAHGLNPVVSPEVNQLKGQLIGLVSGSIESKLRSLEAHIKSGSAANSLGTIEDLKNDIKVLRSYSEISKQGSVEKSNPELAREITHLKGVVYVFLASGALMFVANIGIWIKLQRYLPYKEIKSFLNKGRD